MHTTRASIPKIIIVVLFIAWMLPGLIGRDLWKADEPYSFGLVNHIVKTGDWVVPTLAGEPFMEKPPALYVTAAAFVRAGSPWLKPHDAARLATGLFMMLTAVFMAFTSRELQGKGYGAITVVVLIGCTGLQITAHKLITDVALLTGFTMGFYGLVLSRRRFRLGGVWLGMGIGLGFLSKGLLAPGILGIIALALPIVSKEWRKKSYVHALLTAMLVALPWFIIWPLSLYVRSPRLFIDWFWYQNLGRFLGFSNVGRQFSSFSYFAILPWFALPALPLALWSLWINRKSWRSLPASVIFPLTAFLVMLSVLSLSSSIRDLYALPMLLPLSLLATTGIDTIRDRTRVMLTKFSIGFFALVSLALWIGWLVMTTGHPEIIAAELRALQPGHTPSLNLLLFLIALLYTVVFAFAVIRFSRAGYHPVISWTSGMTLIWALLMTIWLPWFDAGSGYRAVLTSLRESLPAWHGVVASIGVGESERAMLQYYAGIETRRIDAASEIKDVDLLLVESGRVPTDPPARVSWRLIWEGTRPVGDCAKEIFRLYQRVNRRPSEMYKAEAMQESKAQGSVYID